MYGVKANVRAPHKYLRMGALCWVSLTNAGGGNDRITVLGMSRGGRMVRTYVDARDLNNYRAGWHPGENFPYDTWKFTWPSKDEAQSWADAMNATYGQQDVRPHAAKFGITNGKRARPTP
jgi:hypothetical protein